MWPMRCRSTPSSPVSVSGGDFAGVSQSSGCCRSWVTRAGIFSTSAPTGASTRSARCATSENVIAAEANPGMAADLRRIIRRNNQVLPVAMSDQVGETVLHIPTEDGHDVNTRCSVQADANPGLDLRTVTVPTTAIDELGLQQIAVIKIDVEGHELAVLRGGMGTLRRSGPTCIVESEERHNAGGVAQTFDFFDALGYNSYFLHRGALRKGAAFSMS